MTEEKIKKIFKLLNEQFNKDGLLYFKMISLKNIKAYFKSDDEEFATVYVDKVLEYLEDEEDYEDVD